MANQPNRANHTANHLNRRMTAICLSLLISIVLMAAKFYTYHITQSSAVLSDALESIINVVAAAFAVGSIWMAARPPDSDHPYGHGKIEYFSAGFEGALIIFAAIGIFKTGISHLLMPAPLANLQAGLSILVAAAVVNLLLGAALIRIGNRLQSLTLVADGKHVLTDVYTSAGVVAGLILVHWTGWLWLDGAIACMVGVNILLTGMRLVRQSFSALMDASDPGCWMRLPDCSKTIASRSGSISTSCGHGVRVTSCTSTCIWCFPGTICWMMPTPRPKPWNSCSSIISKAMPGCWCTWIPVNQKSVRSVDSQPVISDMRQPMIPLAGIVID